MELQQECTSNQWLLKQGLDWDWTGDLMGLDWAETRIRTFAALYTTYLDHTIVLDEGSPPTELH